MIHHEGVVKGWSILVGLELEFDIGSGLEWGVRVRVRIEVRAVPR